MRFTETRLKGAYIIELDPSQDERGFFAMSWSREEFSKRGLNDKLVECNVSFNAKKGTLRGMHYQLAPHAQAKLVRCTMGAVYDVALDLRPESPTRNKWTAVELTAENRRMFFIPEGFAHGFQTLADNAEVFYQMSEFYHPDAARGVRWNDATFGIEWPDDQRTISLRDRQCPDFVF